MLDVVSKLFGAQIGNQGIEATKRFNVSCYETRLGIVASGGLAVIDSSGLGLPLLP